MGRKITMRGKNAQYIERRAADATPDNEREIIMEGDEAVYQEYAYGQNSQPKQEEKPAEDAAKEYQKEAARKLLMDQAEYVEPIAVKTENAEKKLNYYAPQAMITELLSKRWFDEVCTKKSSFTPKWREDMMVALMKSEYGKDIATEWADPNKRIQVKCKLVGALKDAGVIKGSYNSLAPRLDIDEIESASLAKYMGEGKKQSYFEWLKEYTQQ